jgi:hypothetical protein
MHILSHADAQSNCIGQVLAGLYPAAPGKRSAAVSQFREAANKASASGDVWFMLAELLAPTDPAGLLCSYSSICCCQVCLLLPSVHEQADGRLMAGC